MNYIKSQPWVERYLSQTLNSLKKVMLNGPAKFFSEYPEVEDIFV